MPLGAITFNLLNLYAEPGAVDFWNYDPAGYAVDPAGYAVNPAGYVPVTKDDDPPWD